MAQRLQPEQQAREQIDKMLEAAGWVIQHANEINLYAARGVAVREFRMARGYGIADYLLFVDRKAVGALEAKKVGEPLSGVMPQAQAYSEGLPKQLKAPIRPLPFLYASTGVETLFANGLDPEPRSRRVFAIHRPETLAEWLEPDRFYAATAHQLELGGLAVADAGRPQTLRSYLQSLPPLPERTGLWPNQLEAINSLERSLAANKPRALIQMATGSGKSKTAAASIYRLLKFGGARRVLFLVDRKTLGEQAEDEFAKYVSYDDNRRFTDLYRVQRLTSQTIAASASVVITTIQRLYSILRGEPLDEQDEERSLFEDAGDPTVPKEVVYNSALPPEAFDVIFIDECHRSIYTTWGQVLDYFDSFLVGLTATPSNLTYGFFDGNVVTQYDHETAVAEGVNVDFDIYPIRTKITVQGSTIKAEDGAAIIRRDRRTRRQRWEQPDEDISYTANQLDRDVVAKDQIRLIVRTFRDKLFTDIFPGRTTVPKTLIFAKDDSHAEDIVHVVREEFGRGDAFCQKITYKVTGTTPKALIQEFRTAPEFRIAVTVDMIATGTDIKPLEIVMFMRTVKSRLLYEQMKGRGVRTVETHELRRVTNDADAKTHFVLVDCVGVTESCMQDTRPLEVCKGMSFAKLLDLIGKSSTDPQIAGSLASRLARLDKRCTPAERKRIRELGGVEIRDVVSAIVHALDLDRQIEQTRTELRLPADATPTEEQIAPVAERMMEAALFPIASQPELRNLLQDLKKQHEQIIDMVSVDELLFAGASPGSTAKAQQYVQSFEQYLEEHKDEHEALRFFFSRPYKQRRLSHEALRDLAYAIETPPRQWTPERLWRAYEQLDRDKVKGANATRRLTDVVSLVRYALHQDDELVPYAARVQERYDNWLAQQANRGRTFSDEQRRWLDMIRDHVAQSVEVSMDDFELTPFVEAGGLGKAGQVFAGELAAVVSELNEVLSA